MKSFRQIQYLTFCASFVWLAYTFVMVGRASGSGALAVVRDVVYQPNGEPFQGKVLIVPDGFTEMLRPPTLTIPVADGMLAVTVAPTTPGGASYKVTFISSNSSTRWDETWRVPATNRLYLSDVRIPPSDLGTAQSQRDISLPISINGVSGLSIELSQITTSLSNLSGTVNALSVTLQGVLLNRSIDGEIPAGAANGLNTLFTLVSSPLANTLSLFRNGQRQVLQSDFSLSGNTITFLASSVPQPRDSLLANYTATPSLKSIRPLDSRAITLPIPISDVSGLSAALSSINNSVTSINGTLGALSSQVGSLQAIVSVSGETLAGSLNGNNAIFSLVSQPLNGEVTVFRNGIRLAAGSDLTLSGRTVTFASGAVPQPGDALVADYQHN